jgi:hypothetical protein
MSSVGGDMDLIALEMASLELLTLCDDSGARRGQWSSRTRCWSVRAVRPFG